MKKTILLLSLLVSSLAPAQPLMYKGTVGKLPINLQLSPDGADLSGTYFYQKTIIEIPFNGTKKGTAVELTTYSDMEEDASKSEHFHLKAAGTGFKGTWVKNGKTLPVVLTQLTAAELKCPRIENNPLLQTMEREPISEVKINLFRLKSLDSISYVDHVKLRFFRETHTNLDLFRIDSGLPQAQLDFANQLLERVHIQQYLGYGECSFGGINFEYGFSTSDYCITPGFMSFLVSGGEYCGGAHPNYYSYAVNADLDQKKELLNTDFFIPIADSTAEVQVATTSLTNWQLLLMEHFRHTNPEEMAYDENSDVYDDCGYGNPDVWEYVGDYMITHEGLRVLMTFPHALTPCNDPDWAVIPYSAARKYLKPEIYARLMKIKP